MKWTWSIGDEEEEEEEEKSILNQGRNHHGRLVGANQDVMHIDAANRLKWRYWKA